MKCFVVLSAEGSGEWARAAKKTGSHQQFGEFTRLRIQEACERISYHFSNKLIAYSPCVIDRMKLWRYAKKITICPKYVSDYDLFNTKKTIDERQPLIGYVGRLNEEKGIINLFDAIPLVVRERPYLHFAIIGEGRLGEEIRTSLDHNDTAEHVQLVGWVPNSDLPAWLNKFKLVVIPSYTETGPSILFESLACGTPVLATPVGAVPDVIEDGKTGFIMESNTPECIARNIIRAVSYPDLHQIAENGHGLVRKEFTRDRTLEAWRQILK